MENVAELRARLAFSGLRQADVAAQMGIDESVLSKILSGARAQPDGFRDGFLGALEAVAIRQARHLLAVAAGEGGSKPPRADENGAEPALAAGGESTRSGAV